jgi:hypothetical protein
MDKSIQSLCAAGLACLLGASAAPGAIAAVGRQQGPPANSPATVTTADLSDMMSRMQVMHRKLATASTPAEKQALMVEHFKLIQEGLTMLQQLRLRSAKDATTEQMLEQRMDMMTMLMRMMADREFVAAPASDCADRKPAAPLKRK